MTIYHDFAQVAVDLSGAFDFIDVAICRKIGETHDVVTGADVDGQPKTGVFKCVVKDMPSGNSPEEGTISTRKKREVISPAKTSPFEPEEADEFGPFMGDMWSIGKVNVTAPSGVPIVYKFEISR